MQRIYDLKGSTFKRNALSGARVESEPPPFQILKDLDLLKMEEWLCLSEPALTSFLDIVKKDSQLLASCNLMDYSLLLVRFKLPNRSLEEWRRDERRIAIRALAEKRVQSERTETAAEIELAERPSSHPSQR